MSQSKLSELLKNQQLDGYLLVRSSAVRTGQNGKNYLDMTLADISGEVNAKMWDYALASAPAPGSVIRVRGTMNEYLNKPQFRIDKMRQSTDEDQFDMSQLAPAAPEPPQEMMDYILNRVDAIADRELKEIVLFRLDEVERELMYYPAAQKLHHAERSGLLHHMTDMLRAAKGVCEVYTQLDADLLAAGVVLHDLCKISELKSDEMGIVSEYTAEGQLLGHLVMGVTKLERAGEQLGTRRELLLLLEHMLLSHHDLPEYGSPKPPMFPEAEVLHVLDLLDSRMYEMTLALKSVQPGGFTEKIWSLDRKLYKTQLAKQDEIPETDEAES